MSFAPDIAGYIAAQQQLRQQLGSPVTFMLPVEPTWPDGTAINPDTNTPYDAMAVRTNAESTQIVKTCLLIMKQGSPLRPQSDVRVEAAGEFESMDMILDIDAGDWGDVNAASDFAVNGQTFNVEEAKPFSVGGTIYRYLVYGAEH